MKRLTLIFTLALTLSLISSPIRDDIAAKSLGCSDSADPLPYDAEVEYIEFSGKQGILTDIVPRVYAQDSRIYIDYQLTRTDVRQLTGSTASYLEFCSLDGFVQNDSQYPADFARHYIETIGTPHRVLFDGNTINRGGFVFSANEDPTRIFVFGALRLSGGGNYGIYARVYSVRMEDLNGTERFNWHPVRFTNEYGETEGAFYDSVTGELVRNAGTGSFIIGSDL